MKRNQQAALAAGVLAAALGFGGCGWMSPASSAPQPTPIPTASSAQTSRLGLGVVAEAPGLAGTATASNTAAAVLLDETGHILSIAVDMVHNKQSVDFDGAPKSYTPPLTAREQGDSYGLKNASTLGLEWYQQADNFQRYAAGMTVQQLEALPLGADGKTTDVDLLAGCTIAVDDMVNAAIKACYNAQQAAPTAGQIAVLGMVSVSSQSRPATDDADGLLQLQTSIAAAALDDSGQVSAAICDEVQTSFGVDDDGEVSAPHRVFTKLEQGEEYGMKQASAIGKEWYQQSEAFSGWLAGRTAAGLTGISEQDARADLAAGCTINMTNLLAAAIKAVQQK